MTGSLTLRAIACSLYDLEVSSSANNANLRIAIYGAGALGAYFGARLAHAGADVHLVARGAQLEALQNGPLRVESTHGDFETELRATSETEAIGQCDAVILCVKAYHVDEIAPTLAPLLREGTAVVPLLNGVAHLDTLQSAIGTRHVLGGAAFVFAEVTEPGLVVHSAGPGLIVFGELDGQPSERTRRLDAALSDAGIGTELVENIRERMWVKFAYICAHAGMTAAARLSIGAIRSSAPAWEMFRRLIDEVIELASEEGIELEAGTADALMEFAAGLEPSSMSSMYNDLVAGRRTELEALHGFAVERARQRGLRIPTNEAIYALLAAQAAPLS